MGRVVVLCAVIAAGCRFDSGGQVAGDDVESPDAAGDARPGEEPDAAPGEQIDASPQPLPTLYAGPLDRLFTVDPGDLTVTLIAPFELPGGETILFEDTASSSAGVLHGMDQGYGGIYTIDPATAVSTLLVTLSSHSETFRGLAFGYPGGVETLYAGSNDGDFFSVSLVDGQLTNIGNYGNGLTTGGDIAWHPTVGMLVGAKQGAARKLASVDIGTGVATIRGDTPVSLNGMGVRGTTLFGFGGQGTTYELMLDGTVVRELPSGLGDFAHGAP